MRILHNMLETGVHLVKLNGPLNGNLAEEAKQTFVNMYNKGARRVIINLEDVPFIDSRGLAVLVAGLKIFNKDAQSFRLAAPQTQPGLVFELTGFDKVFQIFDSVTEAVSV